MMCHENNNNRGNQGNSTSSDNAVPQSPAAGQGLQPGGFDELRRSIDSMTADMAALKTENAAFRARVAALEAKLEAAESEAASDRDGLTARILRESSERVLSDRNVIVFGLPEPTGLTPHFRACEDEVAVANVLGSVAVPMPVTCNMIRIGSIYRDKPRPLKIVLPSSEDAKTLIRNFHAARRNGARVVPWNVRVCRDRTWLEREVLRAAYAELRLKKRAGERNLIVATINSVPSVTTRKDPF